MNKLKYHLYFVLLLLLSEMAFSANPCTNVFSSAVQTTLSGANISFACGTKVINNPSTIVPTSIVNSPGSCATKTCNTENCMASGTPVTPLSVTFQSSTGSGNVSTSGTIGGTNNATTDYNSVSVPSSGTLGFSTRTSGVTTYRINNLTIGNGATVNLQPGDYWINSLTLSGSSTFTVLGSGTARFFVNNDITVFQSVNWNSAGSASKLLLYTIGNISINTTASSTIKGILFAQQSATLSGSGALAITGAIAADNLNLGGNLSITYDSAAVNALDFGPNLPASCEGTSSCAAFSGPLETNAAGTQVTMTCGSKVINAPTTVLPTSNIIPASCTPPTCNTVNCTASGAPVGAINPGTFQASSGTGGGKSASSGTLTLDGNNNTTTDYTTVSLSNSTLNFTAKSTGNTVYRINTLSLSGATVNLQPGDYWINTLSLSGSNIFNVVGTGTARLFVNGPTAFSGVSATGTADKLLIYDYSTVSLSSANINAFIYAVGTVNISGSTIKGGITGGGVSISDTTITYDPVAAAALNFGSNFPSSCGGASSPTGFTVSAPTTGSFCGATAVTVTAVNSIGTVVNQYTGQITLDTQSGSGTWSLTTGAGSFTNLGAGKALYTYALADAGVAKFALNYPATGTSPITIRAYQTNNTVVTGLSNPVTFSPSGFLITGQSVAQSTTPFNGNVGAGNAFTLYITAYNSGCGTITSYTGTKTIRFWSNYVNPATGTMKMTINGTAIANSAGATQTTKSLVFTNGVATVTAVYPDVGQLLLNAQDTASGGPSGSTGNFVIMPDHFAIAISPTNSAVQNTSLASCVSDAKFIGAGQPFTVNIQPQNAQNSVTPNFGNETPAQTLSLTGPVVAPAGGVGTLSNTTSTKITSGTNPFTQYPFFKSTPNFTEVGCINLTYGVVNYIAAGATVTNSVVVGRFIPDHFTIQTGLNVQPIMDTANTSFTYMDQPFTFATIPKLVVQAQNAQNSVTQNYTGQFAKLFSAGINYQFTLGSYPVNGTDIIPSVSLTPSITLTSAVPTISNGTGTFTLTDGGSGFKIPRQAGVLVPPFYAEIQLQIPKIQDADNVQCDGSCSCIPGVVGCTASPNNNRGFAFGNTTLGNGVAFDGTGSGVKKGKLFYFGRMVVVNAVGPEILPLAVPFQTQYYTSNGFVLNTNDSVTPSSAFSTPNNPPTCPVTGSPNPILCAATGITNTIQTPVPANFSLGQAIITLTAPNATGYVDIIPQLQASGANLPWLQFAWPSDTSNPTGAYIDNPRGRASFGVFKGNSGVIYRSEQYK